MKLIHLSGSFITASARAIRVAGAMGLLTLLTLALPRAASASVIASDGFEAYPAAVTVVGDGTASGGWAGAWDQGGGGNPRATVIDTTGSSMSFVVPGGATIDGAARALEIQLTGAASSQPAARRQLAVPLAQTFYVGYLVRYVPGDATATWAGANNTFSMHLADTSGNTATTLNFGLRGGAGADIMMRFGTGAPVAGASIPGTIVTNRDYYLVCKMVWNGSAYTSAIMWTNPPLNGETLLPGGNASLSGFSEGAVNYLFWREAVLDANDILRVDALTIGTTWTDVVPPLGPPVPQCSVETKADGTGTVVPAQPLTAGQSITMYAIVRDAGGNYLSNTPASWSPVNVTGGIAGGDIVPAGNGQSAVFTAHLAGSANIQANPPTGATNYINSGLITVVSGPATQVRVETAPDGTGTLVPAQVLPPLYPTVTGYAITRDVGGNFLNNVAATWSEQNVTGGITSSDLVPAGGNKSATFTGNLSGTATLQAFVSGLTPVNSGLITVTRSVVWSGNSSALWNHSALNWTPDYGATQTKFYDQDSVTFAGIDSQPNVNLTDSVLPYSITVSGGTYTIAGSGGITGLCALTNSSGNTLTLLTSNTYTGPTVISYGALQVGNGTQNGSLGVGGNVSINTGANSINYGGTDSLIFNRTDSVAAPYLVSNTISGIADFCLDVNSGAVKLTGAGADAHCNALVKSGATLLLGKNTVGGGAALGNSTALGTYVLNVNAGGKCMLASDVGDHITAAGKLLQIDGTFDAAGHSEAFGVIQGAGVLDNSAVTNATLTICQGSSTFPGVGNGGEIFTWNGVIKNTGTGTLAITKDGTNTLILANADTYNGDTRSIDGGVLQLGNVNSLQGSTYNQASGDSGSLSFGSLTSATLGGLKGGTAAGLGLTNSAGTAVALTIGGNGQTNTFATVISGPGSLTKTGTGIQTLSGTNTYGGNTTVSQGGLLVNGALAGGSVTVASGATLGGKGTIGGATTIQAGGTLAPGTPAPGILTVGAAVTLQANSATVIQLNRTNSITSGRLTAPSIALNGALTVTNVGPALASGDTFTLFSGSLSGTITPASLPPLLNGLSWDTSTLNTAGTIAVTGTVITTPPVLSSVSAAGGNLTLSGSGGTPGGTYYVISTNTLAAPRSTWPAIATNTYAPNGNFTNVVVINPAASESFFSIRQ